MAFNFKKLADQAKKIVDSRGGVDALKDDATELKDIATSEGSLKDKATAAVDAVKDPGAPGEDGKPAPAADTAGQKPQ